MLSLEDFGGLDALPGCSNLDEDAVFRDSNDFVQLRSMVSVGQVGDGLLDVHALTIWSAFSTVAFVSKEKRASTSVETLPGIILRISRPNSTKRRSRAASTLSFRVVPCSRSVAIKQNRGLLTWLRP